MVTRRTAEEAAEDIAGQTQAAPEGSRPDIFDEQIAQRSAAQAERERRAEQIAQIGDRSARRHPNLYAVAVNDEAGLRLEREEKRTPGQTTTRLLLSFAEDKLPS